MFSALQDSFRWTNAIVGELMTGIVGRPRAYVWRPALDIRDGRTVCTLTTFAYH